MKKPTGGSALNSFPLTGKDKGRGDWFERFWSIKGKRVQIRCNDMPPFSSSVGERKIMNHLVVTKSTRQCQILHTEA